jgi:uroporphyrinogen III methyltransferase/synthase
MGDQPNALGKVFLVGAGPGSPHLITLRGLECIQAADAILFDYLVNPRLLEHVQQHCELISLGSHAAGRLMEQEEINQRMVDLARQGRQVVRLKCGDPAVFARLSEELAALAAAGISFEIVPGITAAFASSSLIGLPITDRESASAVALVTGHEQAGKTSALDFHALAKFPGTLMIYMGTTTVDRWSRDLIDAGKPPETPCLIVRRATFPDQSSIACRLDCVSAEINRPQKIRPPVVFIVGAVAAPDKMHPWFERRELFGQRILLCRSLAQSREVRAQFESAGAEVLIQPAIEIGEPDDFTALDKCLRMFSRYHWIVFSSCNGVDAFFGRLFQQGYDSRLLGKVKLAAAGDKTSAQLRKFGFVADLVPETFRAEELAESLKSVAAGQRFLLIRADRGRDLLRTQLQSFGAEVDQVVAYSSRDVQQVDPLIADQMRAGNIDWTVVSSSAIAKSIVSLFGEDLRKTKLASISPITSDTLRAAGFEPAVEATEFSFSGIQAAMQKASSI